MLTAGGAEILRNLDSLDTRQVFSLSMGVVRSGSALIWLSWNRIRIGNANPNPGAMKLNKIN
jgi:hypothetical protein